MAQLGLVVGGAGVLAGSLPARLGALGDADRREPEVVRRFQFGQGVYSVDVYRRQGRVVGGGRAPAPPRPTRVPAVGERWERARAAPPAAAPAAVWTTTALKASNAGLPSVRDRRRALEGGVPYQLRMGARIRAEGAACAFSEHRRAVRAGAEAPGGAQTLSAGAPLWTPAQPWSAAAPAAGEVVAPAGAGGRAASPTAAASDESFWSDDSSVEIPSDTDLYKNEEAGFFPDLHGRGLYRAVGGTALPGTVPYARLASPSASDSPGHAGGDSDASGDYGQDTDYSSDDGRGGGRLGGGVGAAAAGALPASARPAPRGGDGDAGPSAVAAAHAGGAYNSTNHTGPRRPPTSTPALFGGAARARPRPAGAAAPRRGRRLRSDLLRMQQGGRAPATSVRPATAPPSERHPARRGRFNAKAGGRKSGGSLPPPCGPAPTMGCATEEKEENEEKKKKNESGGPSLPARGAAATDVVPCTEGEGDGNLVAPADVPLSAPRRVSLIKLTRPPTPARLDRLQYDERRWADDAQWTAAASPVGAGGTFTVLAWHVGLAGVVPVWAAMGGRLVGASEESALTRERLPPAVRALVYASPQLSAQAVREVDVILTQPDVQGSAAPTTRSSSTQAFADLEALQFVNAKVFVAVLAPDFVRRGRRKTWARYLQALRERGFFRRGARIVSAADLGGKVDDRRLLAVFSKVHGPAVDWAPPRAGPASAAMRMAFDEPFVDSGGNVVHARGRRPPGFPPGFCSKLGPDNGPSRPRQVGYFGHDTPGWRVYDCERPAPQPTDGAADDFFAGAAWVPSPVPAEWWVAPRCLSLAEEMRARGLDTATPMPGRVAAAKSLVRRALPSVTSLMLGETVAALVLGTSVRAAVEPPAPAAGAAVDAPLTRSPRAGRCHRRALARVVGELQYVAKAMPRYGYLTPLYNALHGKQYVSWDETEHVEHGLLFDARGRPRYDVEVPLNDVFWNAMDDLGTALARSDGVYVFRGGGIVVHEAYGDASPAGAGNIDVAPGGDVTYKAGKWRPEEVARSSNWKEMRTVLSRLEAEVKAQRESGASKYNGCVLYVCTDNSTTAYAAERGSSASRRLLELVRRIRLAEATLKCQVVVVWISGKKIIEAGADGVSRDVFGEGLTGTGPERDAHRSPLTQPGAFPSTHLLQALRQAFPGYRILLQPDEWVERHFDGPVVIVAPNLLVRDAIHQVKEVDRYNKGHTEAVVVAEQAHAQGWTRERRFATCVVTVKAGQWGHPVGAEGPVVLLHFQAGVPQDKHLVQVTADDFRPGFCPRFEGPCTTVEWAIVPERTHLLAGAGDVLANGQTREEAANDPSTCPCCPLGEVCSAPRVRAEFPPSAAAHIDRWAYLWTMRRAWAAARSRLPPDSPLLDVADEALLVQYRRRWNVSPVSPVGPCLAWFKFKGAEWEDVGVGLQLPLNNVPQPFDIGNYASAQTPEACAEATRVITAGYAAGPFDAGDEPNFRLGTPLGTVQKSDGGGARNYMDAGASGLNLATAGLNFLYDAHPEMFGMLYPDCYYFKGDWSDAFLGVKVHEAYRKYFGFEHPAYMADRRATFTPECMERYDRFVGRFQRGHQFTADDLAVLDLDSRQAFERMRQPVPKHHYARLIFGWVLSPYFFTRLAQIVVDRTRQAPEFAGRLVFNAAHPNCPAMRHHRSLPVLYRVAADGSVAARMYQYMDDGVGCAPSLYHARRALRRMLAEIYAVGGAPKTTKTLEPTQHGGAILGLGADTRGGIRIVIPPERLAKTTATLENFTLLYGEQRPPPSGHGRL